MEYVLNDLFHICNSLLIDVSRTDVSEVECTALC